MKTATKISIVNGIFLTVLVLLEFSGTIKFPLLLPYHWHKILHIFGVAMFMANMIVGPIWFFYAYYSKDKTLLRFADKLLRLTDLSITIPGLALAVINGLFLSTAFGGSSNQPWLQYSIILMIAMWVLSFPVLYIQEKIYQTIEHEPDNQTKLKKWVNQWSVWGTILTIPPSIIFYLMVVKAV